MRFRCRIITMWLALLPVVAGCAGSTPGRPSLSGPNVVRINDPGGALRTHETTIRMHIAAAMDSVTVVLPVTGVTITVIADPAGTIPGYGLGGFTPDGSTVKIFLDAAFPGFAQTLGDRLPPLVAHEIHHAMRWRGPGYGRTLLEAMVSEGLADRFAVERLGAAVPPWSDALASDSTEHYLDRARPEFDSSTYGHPRWFFGADPTLPRWTGYTLGYRLVERYQASHPGVSAAQLVAAPADSFRPLP